VGVNKRIVVNAVWIGAVVAAAVVGALLVWEHQRLLNGLPATPTPVTEVVPGPTVKTSDCHYRQAANGSPAILPDPACTPGVTDPRVTQDNITQTICVSGYTARVRPTASFTTALKRQQLVAYGHPGDLLSGYEEDHLISLELGGAPSDAANLWPEPQASPNPKDTIENHLHSLVCSGRLPLAEAQHRIATDWSTALDGLP
jgi:hypothetical protein